jgi:PKD repeat protein/N-acetylneuraminic acid mutarotase
MRKKLLLVFFYVFIASFTCSAQWTLMAPMVNARGQHAAVAHPNGNVYVWGGFVGVGNPMSSLEIYNEATDTWSSGASLPVATRGQAFALGQDNMIYSISGYNFSYINDVYKYDVAANTWTAIPPIPTACWESAAATGASGSIYIFGGENAMNLLQIYNPVSNMWGSGASLPVGVRMQSAVAAPNGKIYVIGGYNGITAVNNNQIYDPVLDSWSTGAPLPTARCQFGATLGPDGKIYIVGGKTSGFNNQPPFFDLVDIYDPNTDTWTTATPVPATIGETEAVTVNGGIHLLAGTDGNYLTTNYRMEVAACTSLVVTTTPSTAICIGQNTTLTANVTGGNPGYNYLWSTGSNSTSINVSPSSTTTYYITVTDSINCTVVSQPITVSVSPPITLSAAGNVAICDGASVQVSAQANGGDGNFTYTWSPNIGSGPGPFTVSPNTTTTYMVTVTDGCGTPANPDSATVIVHPLPDPAFSGTNLAGCTPLVSCFTDMSTVSSGTVTQWVWSFGDVSPVSLTQSPCHSYNTPGQYSVTLTATSNAGCTQSFTAANYAEAYPVTQAAFTQTTIGLNVYFFDGSPTSVAWHWDFGDSTTDTTQNPMHTFPTGGQYIVCLTAPNTYGCSDTICHIINVIDVGINETSTANGITVFPNPAGNQLTIYNLRSTISKIEIYDVLGNITLSQMPATGSQKQTINISECNPGVYFVRILDADHNYSTLKFMKL